MVRLTIYWTQTAINQRNYIFKYWNKRNKSFKYSRKLNTSIKERTSLLKLNPKLGKKTEFNNTRVISLGHYSIFYKNKNSNIYIMSFWDNRQNPIKLHNYLKNNKSTKK